LLQWHSSPKRQRLYFCFAGIPSWLEVRFSSRRNLPGDLDEMWATKNPTVNNDLN
jgi:hypothetical protein